MSTATVTGSNTTLTPQIVLPGMDGVGGGAISAATNQFYFVESDGDIHRIKIPADGPWQDTSVHVPYNSLVDIALSRDGRYAYVTNLGGEIIKIDLGKSHFTSQPTAAQYDLLATKTSQPRQIALDENRNVAYVVEPATAQASGRLLRVNLKNGDSSATTIVGGLKPTGGVAITRDGNFAYVAEQGGPGTGQGKITRIDLTQTHRGTKTVAQGLTEPFFLSFLDDAQTQLLVTQRSPENQVMLVSVLNGQVSELACVHRAQKAVVIAPYKVVVCSDSGLSTLDLLPHDTATQQILLGFGLVPWHCITQGDLNPNKNGCANTSLDPKVSKVYSVTDAPFGGSLTVMVNHEQAKQKQANYYRIEVDGEPVSTPFMDQRRLPPSYDPEWVLTPPGKDNLFPVRDPNTLKYWDNEGLVGGVIDTTNKNAMHMVTIRLFSAEDLNTEIDKNDLASRQVQILVDNSQPLASIDQILLKSGTPPQIKPVDACGFAYIGKPVLKLGQSLDDPPDTPDDNFQFVITAEHPGQHLANWSLQVAWGNNQSMTVASESWPLPSASNNPLWLGLAPNSLIPSSAYVPPPAGNNTSPSDPYWHAWSAKDPAGSTNCAHSFSLTVYDRVTNGWGAAHLPATYTRFITILALPEPNKGQPAP